MCEGVSIMNLVIALLENLMGVMDNALTKLVQILLTELNFIAINEGKLNSKNYKSMIL